MSRPRRPTIVDPNRPANAVFAPPTSAWDDPDPTLGLARFSKSTLDSYQDDGYGTLENQLVQQAKPLSLRDLVTRSQIHDAAIARQFSAAGNSKAWADLHRTGMVQYDPSDDRAIQRSAAAAQVQARNQSFRDAVSERNLARRGLSDIAGGYDSVALDSLSSSAAVDALARNRAELVKAGNKAANKAALGNLIGTGITAAAMFMSSRSFKTDKAPVSILDKLASVPVEQWRYTGERQLHIGPYAEDFNAAFGLDPNPYIDVIDYLGVLLGAVKELNDKIEGARNGV